MICAKWYKGRELEIDHVFGRFRTIHAPERRSGGAPRGLTSAGNRHHPPLRVWIWGTRNSFIEKIPKSRRNLSGSNIDPLGQMGHPVQAGCFIRSGWVTNEDRSLIRIVRDLEVKFESVLSGYSRIETPWSEGHKTGGSHSHRLVHGST
jgi:hypothetical protein